jgi:hypothetical protein
MNRLLIIPMLLWSLATGAAQPLSISEGAVINFGFATQLGSGIYSVSGRTLQVYRLPFAYALPGSEDSRYQPRLTLPVTFGFLDFRPRDVVDSGLPERIDSISLVPGLALEIRMSEAWSLEPFIEAGVSRDRSSEINQRVYAIGMRSIHDLGSGVTNRELVGEILHAVVDLPDANERDDFTRLRLGASSRRPFRPDDGGRRPDFLAYGIVDLFSDVPAGPASAERGQDGLVQFELGVTFGATEKLHLWRIPLPRVGLGYRFGEGLSVYRIVFGSPY